MKSRFGFGYGIMIEVLFGDSEAAAMKAAKNTVLIGGADGPTSVWMAGKKKPPEKLLALFLTATGAKFRRKNLRDSCPVKKC